MDLRLLSKLQGADTVTLILRESNAEMLEYYIVSQTVAYSVVCSGICSGSLDREMICFNIRMSSLMPLIEKGYKLSIQYVAEQLRFVSEDGVIEITPLYVEYRDPAADAIIERYLRLNSALAEEESRAERLEALQSDLAQLKASYRNASMMHLSGGPSDNPFGEDTYLEALDGKYDELAREKQGRINELLRAKSLVTECDFQKFGNISMAAARVKEVVDFCGDYAIVSFKDAFLLQKGECPMMSVAGQLLGLLIKDGEGKGFFKFEDEFVYIRGKKDKTVVFISRYLPSNTVDSSIVTRGVVEEKYSIRLKGVLDLATLVRSKFPELKFDMGNGQFVLSNANGEVIRSKFEVESATTLQLLKMKRGEHVSGGVTMAEIVVPKSVRANLAFFRSSLTIYVKRNKVVFQSGDLYLVFSR